MKTTRLCLSLGMIILSAQFALAHERVWPGKRLASVWPEAAKFISKQVNLSAAQIEHLKEDGITVGAEDKSPVFYFANAAGKGKSAQTLGIILFIDAYGENGKMEISVGLTAGGTVKKLNIWEHSETKSVSSAEFLNQFIGKTHADPFTAGTDFKPAEGAQKASDAVARAVKKALSITDAVFGRKEAGTPAKTGNIAGETPAPAKKKVDEHKDGDKHE